MDVFKDPLGLKSLHKGYMWQTSIKENKKFNAHMCFPISPIVNKENVC